MLGMTTTSNPGDTGVKEIASALGGGIQEGSLVIIEGETKTGKSVWCQHIAYGILHSKTNAVAYFTTDYNSEMLSMQMNSMSLDITHDLVTDRLRIIEVEPTDVAEEAEKSLQNIIDQILALPPRFKLIIIDSPSVFMLRLKPIVKMDFLQSCKGICELDRSIVLTLNAHILEKNIRIRTYDMSDYYLRLKSPDLILEKGQIDNRVIKFLEVTKLSGAERHVPEPYRFEIKPRIGIRILPFIKVRV